MSFIGSLLIFLLQVYSFVIILQVLISWLIVFDVINVRNDKAQNLLRLLNRLTDPVYSRLSKFIPPIAGMDLTPMVVLFAIYFLQMLIGRMFIAYGIYGF
ncbi:MAG: YggT family protein [Rhodospirillales bacterium]|nr:YggT family protein [Rhodospirillales bacterium]MCB9973033.1 YggT family protein [Rhodospirillales bacterium]